MDVSAATISLLPPVHPSTGLFVHPRIIEPTPTYDRKHRRPPSAELTPSRTSPGYYCRGNLFILTKLNFLSELSSLVQIV